LGYDFVLATDLDGTFLGGSDAQRETLYRFLETQRDNSLLVFVTGRDLDFIRSLFDEPGFPRPDYIIGDVGTTIVHGDTFEPLSEVQDWVAARWQNANARVKAMLEGEPGLRLQNVDPERRVSYYYEPASLQPDTVQKITDAGFDCITSADIYLDVMPKGVAKGPTLLRFIEALDLHKDDVVTAGDTLNDLSLFQTDLQGIAMGNSEEKLAAAIKELDNVYHSPKPGAAGILDGLQHFGKIDLADVPSELEKSL
jgi:HAD superfamily hydrolase (TIGR01484 family)